MKSNAAALLFVRRLCGGCWTVRPSTYDDFAMLLSRGMRARERGEDWLSHRIRHNVQRPGQIVCRNNGSVFPSSDNIYLTK